jgi:DNA-binding response OmpR family regulator
MTAPSTSVKKIEKQPQLTERVVSPTGSQTQILVAEPEPDLQHIYDIWLRSLGFKNILITDSGRTCLDELLKIKNKSDVIVVLDSHLKDIPIVELAEQIADRKTGNRLIFTTTFPRDIISSMGINTNNKSEILTKPFRFSELLSLIRSNTK